MTETKHVKINIQGMTCAACSASVERALRRADGVVQVNVNLATNSATVLCDPSVSEQMLVEIVNKLRQEIPDIVLRTTLISGFPGETQEQHEELMDFVDQMEFDRLGVFTYSPEEDTPAASMPDQIPEEVKEERQAELMELQQDIVFDQAEDRIGEELLVMIEGKVADENAYVGRTYRDAPNVDGLIFVNTSEELMSGDFAKVKVTGAADYDLIGELL